MRLYTNGVFQQNSPVAQTATIEIGAEVKILAKAMLKQIGRVCTDLNDQRSHFRRYNQNCVTVAVVGVNYAPHATGYEGDRSYRTDGRKYPHPIQEAAVAEQRIVADVSPNFDETIFLRFKATNESPFASIG